MRQNDQSGSYQERLNSCGRKDEDLSKKSNLQVNPIVLTEVTFGETLYFSQQLIKFSTLTKQLCVNRTLKCEHNIETTNEDITQICRKFFEILSKD